jgi:hypothetical protein
MIGAELRSLRLGKTPFAEQGSIINTTAMPLASCPQNAPKCDGEFAFSENDSSRKLLSCGYFC